MAQTKGGNNESQPATQPKQVCKGRRENQTRTQKKIPKIDNFCQTHHLIKCPYFYGGYIVKRLWQQYIPHQVQTLHLWCCAFFATITVDITTIILLSHIRTRPTGRKQGRKQVHGPAHSLTGYQTYPRHPRRIMHEKRMEILTPFMSSFSC